MTRTTVHLLRHGEVHNPDKVLYGRLPGFRLSDDGQQMARDAATAVQGRDITALWSSPLQRAQETSAPLAAALDLPVQLDERLVESASQFEGQQVDKRSLLQPRNLWRYRDPRKPSWGEAYLDIARRMLAAVTDVRDQALGHEAVVVSHQLPIWTLRRYVEGRPLAHVPTKRQCGLASLTSLTWVDDQLVTVTYSEPAGEASRRTGFGA